MEPLAYLEGKLREVEIAAEDLASVAETPADYERLARLEEIEAKLRDTIISLV